MRKLLIGASAALLAVVGTSALLTGTAGAHATFSTSSVPADSDVTLYMDVPHERADTVYNTRVVVAMPTGWQATGCQNKATWSCGIGSQDGRQVVTFTKAAGAPRAEDEGFVLSVHTGSAVGSFSVPVLQTYNTGELVSWIGGSGSPNPAPVLRTVASAPPPTAPPATAPPATAAPAPVPGGGASGVPGAPGAGTPTVTALDGSVIPDPTATSPETTADAAAAGTTAETTPDGSIVSAEGVEEADGELASSTSGDSSGGGVNGVLIGGVALLVLVGVAGGLVIRSSRRTSGGGPAS